MPGLIGVVFRGLIVAAALRAVGKSMKGLKRGRHRSRQRNTGVGIHRSLCHRQCIADVVGTRDCVDGLRASDKAPFRARARTRARARETETRGELLRFIFEDEYDDEHDVRNSDYLVIHLLLELDKRKFLPRMSDTYSRTSTTTTNGRTTSNRHHKGETQNG